MSFINTNVPPIECFVRSNFLQNRPRFDPDVDTYLPVCIFGVASIPHRVPLFHFIMEDEGLWFRMPVHAFCWQPCEQDELYNLCLWDSFSSHIAVTQFDLLLEKPMRYIDREKHTRTGTYQFTLDWTHPDKNIPNHGFSEAAGQHKCGHFIKLDSGNYAIQPNNRIRCFEPSFVTKPGQNVIDRKLNNTVWTVENTAKWVLSDDDRYDYEVKARGSGN
jgi:hypothetical protein